MARRLLPPAAGLAALALVATATSAPASVPTPPGTAAYPHTRLEATATDAAGELVLLTATQDGSHSTAHAIDAVTRSAAGVWGAPVELAADPLGLIGDAELAIASDGTGIVAWNQYANAHEQRDTVWARVRHADGSWGPATQIATRTDAFGFDQVEATPGHLAIIYVGTHYKLQAATSTSDGTTWHTTTVPGEEGGDDGSTVVMDPSGGLHSVVESIPRGGGGDLWINRLAPGATKWTRAQHVKTPYLSTDQAQIAVDDRGRELLLYGYVAHNGYRPPGDGEIVGSTAYTLLAQKRAGGALRPVWHSHAAGAAQLSQADGQVRITYERWRGHRRHHANKVLLESTVLGSSAVVKLARSSYGHFWFTAVGGATGAVSWLQPHAAQLYAASVGFSAGTPVLLDDRAEETHWREAATPGQPAVAGSQAFVAWASGFVVDENGSTVDSTTSVAPLS